MATDRYIEIKNLEELNKARKDLGTRIEEKARETEEKYIDFKESLSPDNLIRTAIKSTTTQFNWIPMALAIIRSAPRRPLAPTNPN